MTHLVLSGTNGGGIAVTKPGRHNGDALFLKILIFIIQDMTCLVGGLKLLNAPPNNSFMSPVGQRFFSMTAETLTQKQMILLQLNSVPRKS